MASRRFARLLPSLLSLCGTRPVTVVAVAGIVVVGRGAALMNPGLRAVPGVEQLLVVVRRELVWLEAGMKAFS